jgi:phosphatidylglycerophosphate synthase
MTDLRCGTPALAGPRRRALPAILAVGAGLAVALALVPFAGALPRVVALGFFALVGAVVVEGLGAHHPHRGFGLANAITLVRAAGTAVFFALALEPGLAAASRWAAVAGAVALFALDGLDGWAARRRGEASAFGARFDMEVDAALILALAALATGLGKAGPWVLGLGLMRYGFVLAGRVAPALARPLPPSRRRSAVCGLQVAALALVLAPPLAPPLSPALLATAFAALAWSFAVDVAWLVRRAP